MRARAGLINAEASRGARCRDVGHAYALYTYIQQSDAGFINRYHTLLCR